MHIRSKARSNSKSCSPAPPCTPSRMAVSAAAAPGSDWLAQDERRMLHAVYRVGDMVATIAFYKDCLGMQLLRFRDIPEVRATGRVVLAVGDLLF